MGNTILIAGFIFLVLYCINLVLYNTKNKKIRYFLLPFSFLTTLAGLFGIYFIKPELLQDLDRKKNQLESFNISNWFIEKFDTYLLLSMILILVAILLLSILLIVLKFKNNNHILILKFPLVITFIILVHFIFSITYSLSTAGPLFDLSSYITVLAFCEGALLFIPLHIKKLLYKA